MNEDTIELNFDLIEEVNNINPLKGYKPITIKSLEERIEKYYSMKYSRNMTIQPRTDVLNIFFFGMCLFFLITILSLFIGA